MDWNGNHTSYWIYFPVVPAVQRGTAFEGENERSGESIMGTVIVGIIILSAIGLAARSIYKDKKTGKCCGGDCGHCGGACHCNDTK